MAYFKGYTILLLMNKSFVDYFIYINEDSIHLINLEWSPYAIWCIFFFFGIFYLWIVIIVYIINVIPAQYNYITNLSTTTHAYLLITINYIYNKPNKLKLQNGKKNTFKINISIYWV